MGCMTGLHDSNVLVGLGVLHVCVCVCVCVIFVMISGWLAHVCLLSLCTALVTLSTSSSLTRGVQRRSFLSSRPLGRYKQCMKMYYCYVVEEQSVVCSSHGVGERRVSFPCISLSGVWCSLCELLPPWCVCVCMYCYWCWCWCWHWHWHRYRCHTRSRPLRQDARCCTR